MFKYISNYRVLLISVLLFILMLLSSCINKSLTDRNSELQSNDIDYLITCLNDEDKAQNAFYKLLYCGESVIPHLLSVLRDKDVILDYRMFRILDKLGIHNKDIISAIVIHLDNEDPFYRREAASAIGALVGEYSSIAVPKLISLIKDDNNSATHSAIWAIGQIGLPVAEDAIDEVIDQLINENSEVRGIAASTIKSFYEVDNSIGYDLWMQLTYSDDNEDITEAGYGLATIGIHIEEVLEINKAMVLNYKVKEESMNENNYRDLPYYYPVDNYYTIGLITMCEIADYSYEYMEEVKGIVNDMSTGQKQYLPYALGETSNEAAIDIMIYLLEDSSERIKCITVYNLLYMRSNKYSMKALIKLKELAMGEQSNDSECDEDIALKAKRAINAIVEWNLELPGLLYKE